MMIHPAAPSSDQTPPHLLFSYEIVASEALPAFDPTVAVKQRVLSAKQIQVFNFVIIKSRYVLFPMYALGFLLRFPAIFGPAPVGRALGPAAFVLQIPIVFQVIFALRFEYVRVLTATFEFWFLLMNAAIWTVGFTTYLKDTRALILPSCFIDFVNMLLIEAYFQNPHNVARTAAASACFLFALGVGVSLNAIDEAISQDLFEINNHTLSRKDILVNTMATMITLVIRLSYRKYDALKSAKRASTWVRSIGYRCRIKLRAQYHQQQPGHQYQDLHTASVLSLPAIPLVPPSPIAVERAMGNRLLQMQFAAIPVLFEPADTLVPSVSSSCNLAANVWRARGFYLSGFAGLALSSAAMHPGAHEGHPRVGKVIAVAGLGATLLFWLWFACYLHKKLLQRLCTSFDFLFLYFQLVSAHLCLCDILGWSWISCCSVLGCFLCMQGVLTSDALTPVMRERLAWKTWFIAPILLLNIAMKSALFYSILVENRWGFQNRLLFDSTIGSHSLQFFLLPFFFSREFTLCIWWIRILHRIRTRKSEHELLMMLGNVEFDYQSWRQRQKQSVNVRKPPPNEKASPSPNRDCSKLPHPS